MPDIVLRYPDSLERSANEHDAFRVFLQHVVNRKAVGGLRYGRIDPNQHYMTRLEKELKVYKDKRTGGNREQLLNIAVYAFLESYAPEHPHPHNDPYAKSATRVSRDDE